MSQESGDAITAAYIAKVIDKAVPSVAKLVKVQDDHISIAAAYLKEQVKQPWASDFLTTDLMPYLEKVDGAKWVRSAL